MIVSSLRLNRKELFLCFKNKKMGEKKLFLTFFGKKVVKSGGMWYTMVTKIIGMEESAC